MPQTRASITLPEGMTLEHLRESLSRQIATIYGNSPDGYSYVEATLDGALIVCARTVGVEAESYFRHEWSMVDGAPVVSSDRVPVVERTTYEPAQASARLAVLAAVAPRKFRVRVIGTGLGANSEPAGQWYVPATDEGIGSARKTFGGARVHWHKVGEKFDHVSAATGQWLGTDHDAGYLSDLATTDDGLEATLHLDDDVPAEIVELVAARRVGLSIEAWADRRPALIAGRRVVQLVNFRHGPNGEPASVAIVTDPALRGEILRVAASRKEHQMPEIVAAPAAVPVADEAQKRIDAAVTAAEAAAKLAETEAKALSVRRVRADLDAALRASKLPEDAVDLVRASFEADVAAGKEPAPAAVQAAIEKARKLLPTAPVNASGQVSVGAGAQDKMALCLERMLLGNAPKYARDRYSKLWAGANGKPLEERETAAGIGYSARAWSFRKTFREFTGGDVEDLWTHGTTDAKTRLRASVNLAQWGDVFENVLNIVGLSMQENPEFQAWRRIVRIVPFSGTLKQERVVVGGYANLPAVAEGVDYTTATTPADQGHGYTPAKYGYTESWTREAMMNDRISALSDILMRMAVAADRTKYEFVFDQLTIAGQPTMDYDSTALYHANHGGNLLTTALATGLPAARLVMLKQAQLTNSKRMGINPAFLIVPMDLQETAENLLKPAVQEPGGLTSEREFLRRMNLEIIVVRHWTNTTDWVLAADPNNGLVPTFEMGFESGREQADIFVQDMANVGSVFEADKITVAIKQPYFGGSPLRHEGFVGNDVA